MIKLHIKRMSYFRKVKELISQLKITEVSN